MRKKDGVIRFCVDYRKLNAVSKKNSYLLSKIDEVLDHLSGNYLFSTLVLKSGYWQIKVRPEDREKTVFSIRRGLWQFIVLPFGLCNASAFEPLMEKVLHGLLFRNYLVYLDVIICDKNFIEMTENLKKMFS